MFTEIINPFINVRPKIKKNGRWVDHEEIKEEMYTYRESTALIDNTKVIFNISDKKVIIDELSIGLNQGLYPRLEAYTNTSSENSRLFYGHATQTSTGALSIVNMTKNRYDNYGNQYFETYKTHKSNNELGKGVQDITFIRLKDKVILPHGGKFEFGNNGGDYIGNTYLIYHLSFRTFE